jgi:cell division septum initiation protein DivIVA
VLNNAYDKKSQTPKAELNGNSAVDDKELAVVKETDTPRFVAPTHGGVDIFRQLTELENMVENCRHIGPMMIGFPDDQFHMTLMKIRANLPEEMKRASKLARESERIVEESREQAGQLVEDARKTALLEFEDIKSESARMREAAQQESVRIREATQQEALQAREAVKKEAQRLYEEAQNEARQLLEAAEREAQQRHAEAQAAGEQIIAEARVQAERLVADSEIVQQAQVVAQDLKLRSEEEARATQHGADEYAHDVLTNLETVLGKSLYQVQCGRELLERGR